MMASRTVTMAVAATAVAAFLSHLTESEENAGGKEEEKED